jgi:hypothetical protein
MSPQDPNQGFNQPNYMNEFSSHPFAAPFFQNGFPFSGAQNMQNQSFPTGFPFNSSFQTPPGQPQQQPFQPQPFNFKSLMDGADQLMQVVNKTSPMIKQLAPLFNMMKKF